MTTLTTTKETTNSLIYKTSKVIGDNVIYVTIRLNDECKNGHQDFAITGDIYKGQNKADRNHIAGGCIHEEILKHFPQFAPFVLLHLCDYKGIPAHPTANGFYHLTNGFNKTPINSPKFKAEFCEYYRISAPQFDVLNTSKNTILAEDNEKILLESSESEAAHIYKCIGSSAYLVADLVSLIVRSLDAETDAELPGIGWIDFGIEAIKLATTFPVEVPIEMGILPYLNWGMDGTRIISSGIDAKLGTADHDPMIAQGVAVWDCFASIASLIMEGACFTIEITHSPSAEEIVMDVTSLTESILRSSSVIIDTVTILDHDKLESGPALTAAALALGLFAWTSRLYKLALILSE